MKMLLRSTFSGTLCLAVGLATASCQSQTRRGAGGAQQIATVPVLAQSLTNWTAGITAENDATYQRIILPWLKEHKIEFPAAADGLLVVYQPWGFVGGVAFFVPGKPEGFLSLLNDSGQAVRQLPLTAREWDSVRAVALDGKFFDVPYRNAKMGMDGASVYVEARIDGRYHRVCHWQPDDPVVQRLANLIGRRLDYFFPVDRATPGAAWHAVANAMWAGDKKMLARACTEKGYQSIMKGIPAQEPTASDLNAWAQKWGNWPLSFTRQTAEAAEATFGPKGKEHSTWFLMTPNGWELDKWLPPKPADSSL